MSVIFGAPLQDGQTSLTQPSYSKGSTFADGVRVGPTLDFNYTQPANPIIQLLQPQYSSSSAVLVKSVFNTPLSPQAQITGEGVLLTPIATHSIAPWPGAASSASALTSDDADVALFQGPINSSAVASFSSNSTAVIASPWPQNGGPSWYGQKPGSNECYIQFDTPRALVIWGVGTGDNGAFSGGPVKVEVWSQDGWGQHQYTKYPQINENIIGGTTDGNPNLYLPVSYPGLTEGFAILSNRTHSRILGMRLRGNLAAGEYLAVGTSNCFGLPYYFDYLKSYVNAIQWQGVTELKNMANAVDYENPYGLATNASLMPGQNYDYATFSNAEHAYFTDTNNFYGPQSFTYGISEFDLDYRGTYTPSTAPIKAKAETYSQNRLVISYYVPGADNNYNIQSWSGMSQFNQNGDPSTVPCIVTPNLLGFTPYWEPMP